MRAINSVENVSILPRLFSSRLMSELVKFRFSFLYSEILSRTKIGALLPSDATLLDLLNLAYDIMFHHYRNEYIYKNVLANSMLRGIHDPHFSFMTNELRVGKCRADSVILNGTSTVYEIKSELDSFERIKLQIDAYQTAFDKIFVVTSQKQKAQILCKVPSSVGIIFLTDKKNLEPFRDSQSHKGGVSSSVIFDILRKDEYLPILKKYFGSIPNVPPIIMYKECKNLFCKLEPTIAHDEMVLVLKKRGRRLGEFVKKSPRSLKALSLHTNLSGIQQNKLFEILDENYLSFFKEYNQ